MGGRPVAITGLGVTSCVGSGAERFWSGLLAGPPSGEHRVDDEVAAAAFEDPKARRRADRFTALALAAADEALATAGAPGAPADELGVVIGTGIGGIGTLEDQILTHHERGPRRVSPFLVPMMMPNAAAAAVSMRHGWQGPCETVVTACAAGTHAIAAGARLVADGRCRAVLAGASEAAMTPVGIQGFTNMTALSPTGRSRPFDVARDGFVMAEGSAVLLLEDIDAAADRGAPVLGLVLGSASTADAHHLTAPAPGGAGALACMRRAIADAELSADDIVHVNAHGTSTPRNDAAEAQALAQLLGEAGPPVTSIKGALGHSLGAAGALEAAAVVLSMRHGLLPPTWGFCTPDPELPAIDVVHGEARAWRPGPTLSNSFGFGGHNGCLVVGPP